MSFWTGVKSVFAKVESALETAFRYAKEAGLTDAIVQQALPYIRMASAKYVDNVQRREWVVTALVVKGVPEGVARIAVELAYKLYQSELAKLPAVTKA